MNQEELLAKVCDSAKKRVDVRLAVFKSEVHQAFHNLFKNDPWLKSDGTDLRKEIIETYLSSDILKKWPRFLYEKEEVEILDELLKKTLGNNS